MKKHLIVMGITFVLLLGAVFVPHYSQAQTTLGGQSNPSVGGQSNTVLNGQSNIVLGGSSTCTSDTGSGGLTNPLTVGCLGDLLKAVINIVVTLGTIFLTIMIIYVGFLFVSARGNEEKISSARTALIWTVVGGLLLLGASAIAQVIASTASSL